MRLVRLTAIAAIIFTCRGAPASAEVVNVKYGGSVNLVTFACTDVSRSSFVTRVCYDRAKSYMVVGLKDTYYHHCAIDSGTVDRFLNSELMGRFYNASIRSKPDGTHGPFDCRDHPVPSYR